MNKEKEESMINALANISEGMCRVSSDEEINDIISKELTGEKEYDKEILRHVRIMRLLEEEAKARKRLRG
ncbi:MAG: hypothetical protein COU08_03060 [Candidatus Harrisonbacteria bacterium CG10_big_fil_rev_8_21_14_0_10_42_17]|uniref:Uncharacterized protein n=1 Tax=Candidatus Harrisonbacteria bacterium CG10_big_fil_rev_8_21_14_0_10_42_17 TaxID=1974584 RepID=A0A2M6WHJ6_9BACT|nr:MAG: hypothetical protein COU08_03060 [Candidatus Harrisonbacteria bacterium CG10_big_fil_rev_8_21_14_0_10_42_17]